ncbi:MAG: protein translocase subunit SecF [Chloroflexota bacterium]
MMMDIVGKRYYFFLLSLLLLIPGIISLVLPGGLRPGIDFSSGSIMTVRFDQAADQSALREEFTALGHPEAIVQKSGSEGGTYLVRTLTLQPEQKDASGKVTEVSERQKVEEALKAKFGQMEVLAFDSVSPIIASEIVRNAIVAVATASMGILLYIAYAFRRVKKSLRWGTCAVIALVHDALVVLGTFSILGRVFHLEVDSMFITAVLTIIGFSVHDTIVVFDRVRENYGRRVGDRLENVINHSIMQTIGRSLTTSMTVLLVLAALYLFGGVTTRNFVLALMIGIAVGTYSSIFVAASLLVVWEYGELKSGWRRLFGGQKQAKAAG